VAWYQNSPEFVCDNPLDQYCETTIRHVIQRFYKNQEFSIFWSHDYQPEKLVSFQRVAVAAGLTFFDKESQLTIHPKFGPWISYRAIAVINDDVPSRPPPPQLRYEEILTSSQVPHEFMEKLKDFSEKLDDATAALISLRDAIELGRQYRFSQPQVLYHYTKDQKFIVVENE
jgi:methylmalonic aciduria homocystinuria type C protein